MREVVVRIPCALMDGAVCWAVLIACLGLPAHADQISLNSMTGVILDNGNVVTSIHGVGVKAGGGSGGVYTWDVLGNFVLSSGDTLTVVGGNAVDIVVANNVSVAGGATIAPSPGTAGGGPARGLVAPAVWPAGGAGGGAGGSLSGGAGPNGSSSTPTNGGGTSPQGGNGGAGGALPSGGSSGANGAASIAGTNTGGTGGGTGGAGSSGLAGLGERGGGSAGSGGVGTALGAAGTGGASGGSGGSGQALGGTGAGVGARESMVTMVETP